MAKVWVPISQVFHIRIFPEINFLDFSHLMDFPAISNALENWREYPCISHMMKYMTGWESNGKNHPFYGKSLGTNFPRIPRLMGFTMLWKIWWENPCISQVMKYTIGWGSNGKKHSYYGKSMSTNLPGSPHTMGFLGYCREPIFQTFPIQWAWLSFPMLWEINEKAHVFPMWWSIT